MNTRRWERGRARRCALFRFTSRLIALIAIALFSEYAYPESAFQLHLYTKNIASKEVSSVLRYLEDVQSKLPRQMTLAINHPVKVKFSSFGHKQSGELPVPTCSGEKKKNVLYAYVIGSTIRVNRRLLADIIRGPNDSRSYPCKHGSMYKHAVAVLLHELGHIYDKSDYRSVEERYQLKTCETVRSNRYPNSKHKKIDKKHCRRIRSAFKRKTVISSDRAFLRLVNWKRSFFGLGRSKAKNKIHKRAPDQYEFKNISENFAVNLEYFLLDPDFKCRLPTLYHYYSTHFNHEPFSKHRCTINTKVFLSMPTMKMINLDPDRIYRVNYLLADAGSGLEARFGHALVHLIICAPERTEVGPDCEKDTSYHVVLSFAAHVDDLQLNYFKGMFGGYGSQPFLLPLNKVLADYNHKQLRGLSSYSLNLTRKQTQFVVYKILELYWTYLGSYRFLTNNCATETRELFQSALSNGPMLHSRAITPRKVLRHLVKREISDLETAEDETLSYPGHADMLIQHYSRVYPDEFISDQIASGGRKVRVVKRIRKHLSRLDPEEFLVKFNEATAGELMHARVLYQDPSRMPFAALTRAVQDIESQFRTALSYRFLTLYARMELRGRLNATRARFVNTLTRDGKNELGQKFQEFREAVERLLPYYLPNGGYGIPLETEMIATSTRSQLEGQKHRLNSELYKLINSHRKMKKRRIQRNIERLENLEKTAHSISRQINGLRILKNKVLPLFIRNYYEEMLQDSENASVIGQQVESLKRYATSDEQGALERVAEQIYSDLNNYLGIDVVNSTYVNPWGLAQIVRELDGTGRT